MPFEYLLKRGIHVETIAAVFADPVAEMGIALALRLSRNIIDADLAFRTGDEMWGSDRNYNSSFLSRSRTSIIGFGDLGRSLARVIIGFRT